MEMLTYDELYSVLLDLEEAAKCCVCLELLDPPVLLCENGHAICFKCKNTLTQCPMCTANFSPIIPAVLNNMLTSLPKLCPNSVRGCTRYVTKYNQKHEEMCSMRTEQCLLRDCTWSGNVSHLRNHVQSEHFDQVVYQETNHCFWSDPDFSENDCDVTLACAYGCLFWKYERTDLKKNKLLVFIRCIPIGDEIVKNFYSIISFGAENLPLEYTYSQKCELVRNVNIDEVFEKENCMAIPLDMLALLTNKDKEINYTFRIIELNKQEK